MSNHQDYYLQWGVCPECTEYRKERIQWLNVGAQHWIVCHLHRVKWCVGENLLSGWRDETEDTWRTNAELLEGYRTVEPFIVVSGVGQISSSRVQKPRGASIFTNERKPHNEQA